MVIMFNIWLRPRTIQNIFGNYIIHKNQVINYYVKSHIHDSKSNSSYAIVDLFKIYCHGSVKYTQIIYRCLSPYLVL